MSVSLYSGSRSAFLRRRLDVPLQTICILISKSVSLNLQCVARVRSRVWNSSVDSSALCFAWRKLYISKIGFLAGSKCLVNASFAVSYSSPVSVKVLKISCTSGPAWYNNKARFRLSSVMSAAMRYVSNRSFQFVHRAPVFVGSDFGWNCGIGETLFAVAILAVNLFHFIILVAIVNHYFIRVGMQRIITRVFLSKISN